MGMIPDQDREFLKNKFSEELQSRVKIVAFTRKPAEVTQPGLECEFCAETEELVREVAELSDKIKVESREFLPDDELVRELGIDKLPAIILISDSVRGVRFYGIPGGFEFTSFVEDIVDVSCNSTDLDENVKNRIRAIDRDVHIQVFFTPTCPYCPSAVRTAHQMAIENPRHIRADAIEAAEFPQLISDYDVSVVPTVVINDKVQFEGVPSEEDFVERISEALAA
jgi:glutaredoxin-like protein